jgi:hypothetical protein
VLQFRNNVEVCYSFVTIMAMIVFSLFDENIEVNLEFD